MSKLKIPKWNLNVFWLFPNYFWVVIYYLQFSWVKFINLYISAKLIEIVFKHFKMFNHPFHGQKDCPWSSITFLTDNPLFEIFKKIMTNIYCYIKPRFCVRVCQKISVAIACFILCFAIFTIFCLCLRFD